MDPFSHNGLQIQEANIDTTERRNSDLGIFQGTAFLWGIMTKDH